ncbi:glycosyltransferase family 4 protein [Oerskovia flava]|uniref:glycosyltransferase family 4 protein n=1 Tax=Oerskovia flava TaxID=2986422 RepID=UPI0022408669|nr:glycosyltransferase family 4 protein [Oerskovia sp. JB1-3-2]
MRITHITDSYLPSLGGIEVQVSGLAQRQAAAGHEVHVITSTPAARGDHGLSVEHEGPVTVHRLAARVPGDLPLHPRPAHHVRNLLADTKPDVVHLHTGVLAPTTQASFRPVVRAGIPAVFTLHSVLSHYAAAHALLDRLVGWTRWPILLTAVSELAATPLRRIARDRVPVLVLHNGVDLDAWRVPRTERADRAEGTAVHAVAATRFNPRKRVLPLLEAVRDAGERVDARALHVTIAGEGPELDDARRFVARHGIRDRVSLPGRLSPVELKRLYARSDVYLAPGVKDAFSVAVQEAQAAGLAILCRSQSGAAECLEHGVNGLLADDDAALSDELVRLATEDGLLDSIVAHNRSTPPATTWPTVLADTMAAYERAVAARDEFDARRVRA